MKNNKYEIIAYIVCIIEVIIESIIGYLMIDSIRIHDTKTMIYMGIIAVTIIEFLIIEKIFEDPDDKYETIKMNVSKF